MFNIRRRSAYGRFYDPFPSNPNNNLPYITRKGYNYDRKREKDEGNDWDEPDQ